MAITSYFCSMYIYYYNYVNNNPAVTGRQLKEVTLDEPIRYGLNDPIEKWLNDLLCLKATEEID